MVLSATRRGPVREVIVHDRYRIRLKRHRLPATVATYPTQGALNFMEQPNGQLVLEGMEHIRLILGYLWDNDSDEVGAAVLSMRDGIDNVLWVHELDDTPDSAVALPRRTQPAPAVVRSRLGAMTEEAQRSRQP